MKNTIARGVIGAFMLMIATILSTTTTMAQNAGTLEFNPFIANWADFTIHGRTTCQYQVEESFDLQSWHALNPTPIIAPSDTFDTVLSVASGVPQAFYRFKELPPGPLTISFDTSTSWFLYALGGSTGITAMGIDLTASTNEAVSLQTLGLDFWVPSSGEPQDIIRLTVWSGSLLVGEGHFTNDGASTAIALSSPVIIPAGSTIPLIVKMDVADVESGMASSGDYISIATDASLTQGIGSGSNDAVTAVGTAAGSGIVLVKSLPTIAQIPLPVPGMDQLGYNTNGFLQFSITASSTGSVGIGKLSIAVQGSGIGEVSLNVQAFTDAALTQPVPGFGVNGILATNQNVSPYPDDPDSSGNIIQVYPEDTNGTVKALEIPAGTTYYFRVNEVFGDKDTASVTTTLLTEEAGGGVHLFSDLDSIPYGFFIWTDNSLDNPSAYSDDDWFNSYLLPGMGSNGGLSQTRTN